MHRQLDVEMRDKSNEQVSTLPEKPQLTQSKPSIQLKRKTTLLNIHQIVDIKPNAMWTSHTILLITAVVNRNHSQLQIVMTR